MEQGRDDYQTYAGHSEKLLRMCIVTSKDFWRNGPKDTVGCSIGGRVLEKRKPGAEARVT